MDRLLTIFIAVGTLVMAWATWQLAKETVKANKTSNQLYEASQTPWVFPASLETVYDERGSRRRPDPTLTFTLKLKNSGTGPAFKFRFEPHILVDKKEIDASSFGMSVAPDVIAPQQRITQSIAISSGGLAENIVNGSRLEISTDTSYCSVTSKCQSYQHKYHYNPDAKKIEPIR